MNLKIFKFSVFCDKVKYSKDELHLVYPVWYSIRRRIKIPVEIKISLELKNKVINNVHRTNAKSL